MTSKLLYLEISAKSIGNLLKVNLEKLIPIFKSLNTVFRGKNGDFTYLGLVHHCTNS